MHHYVGYLDNRRAECEAVNNITARRHLAELLSTRREHAIVLIECTEPCASAQDLIADTTEEERQ